MKRVLLIAVQVAMFIGSASAQSILPEIKHRADEVIAVWNNQTAPHSNNITEREYIDHKENLFNTTETELFVYPARGTNTGQGVVIVPGGGYYKVCTPWDGFSIAEWLQSVGVTAMVVKYRLPNEGYDEVPYEDVREALRYMRDKGEKWGVQASKVGLLGASAGGHLAGWVSTTLPCEEKPAYSILIYPVVSGSMISTKKNSFSNLLGPDCTAAEVERYSLENCVDENTPPTLLLLSDDDQRVSSLNSILFYKALKYYGIEAAMHVYSFGKHGWAGHDDYHYDKFVKAAMKNWLEIQNNKKIEKR